MSNLGDESMTPSPDPSPIPSTVIVVTPTSERLQLLEPFARFTGDEFNNLRVLVKVKGKCTTDHISAAGKWLKYKGHLENIANNTLIGAMNAETEEVNIVYDFMGDTAGVSIPDLGRRWKQRGQEWLVVAEHNYGEGSAREHASLQVRYLGGRVVLVKSFARIHETNLKKQGVLPLTFVDEKDYGVINACDRVDTSGIRDMINSGGKGGGEIVLEVTKKDGTVKEVRCRHTMSKDQVRWFVNGSAINRDL
jgi:aconitase A